MTEFTSSVTQARTALRQSMRSRLAQLSMPQRAAASASITSQLLVHPAYQVAHVIMLFASPPPGSSGSLIEPDLSVLAMHALQQGKTVLAPRVDWSSRTMQAAVVQRWPADLVSNSFFIKRASSDAPASITLREPPFDAPIYDPAAIHLILVPGLAFDDAGGRLGRGGGFYDRFLPAANPARTLGIGFACQRLDQPIPLLPHDVKLAGLILGE